MKTSSRQSLISAALFWAIAFTLTVTQAAGPLATWNDGKAKQSIIDFGAKVTKKDPADFVPPAERIVTFDNDGTLWCEKPAPVQLYFAIDREKALGPRLPEWKDKEPFASLLKGNVMASLACGDHTLLEMVMATHAGMITGEFDRIVNDWFAIARHPKSGRSNTEMVYQLMTEVLTCLRANGFTTIIVSGGGTDGGDQTSLERTLC